MLRQFATALKLYDRALDIAPSDPDVMAAKASIYQAQGNLRQAASLLSEINGQTPAEETFHIKITQLRLERNYSECVRLLQARQAQFHFNSRTKRPLIQCGLLSCSALLAIRRDAKVTAEQARNTLEPLLQRINQTTSSLRHHCLKLMPRWGTEHLALEAAEQAIVLLPSAKDRVSGPSLEQNLAFIHTVFGENSPAIFDARPAVTNALRAAGVASPSAHYAGPSSGSDPIWDPLRG